MAGLFDQVVNYSPPLLTAGQVNYDGTWNASTNTPTLINPPDALSKGDYYVVSVAGTQFGLSFAVGDWIISNGTAWEKVDLTDSVSSVFGRTGAVVGDSTDYSAVGITNTAIGAANPSTGAFTSLSSSSTTTLNNTTIPASKTLVVTTDKLSALAATTSAELAGVISDETGSGSLVFATSPTLVTPALGTPSALVGTNITGTAAAFNINGTVGATTPSTVAATSVTALSNSGYQAVVGQLTSGDRVGISGQASGSGAALVFFDNAQTTFRPAIFDASSHSLKISGVEKASVTSTGLQGAIGATTASTGAFTTVSATTPIAVASGGTGVSTSTGTTNVVLSNSPTLVTPILGTPSSGTLTSCTGLPISTGVSGLGTGVATALAVNVGSAGAPVVNGGALGTPSSGTVTNLTGTASININGTVGATTPSTGAFTTLSATGGASFTSASSAITYSEGLSGFGSFYAKSSGTNDAYLFLGNTVERGRITANNSNQVIIGVGSSATQIGVFNSTGLAVTGQVDATSTFRAIAGGGGVSQLNFVGNTGNLNAQIQYDQVAANTGQLFFGTNLAGTFATRMTLTSTGLNSTAIGATTPSTGAFTTVSASSTGLVTGTFGVGAAPVSEKMRVQAAAGYNFVVDTNSSSLRISAVNDADSSNVPFIIQGSTVTFVGSTAVNGTLSATGNITRSGSNPYVILDRATTADYSGIKLLTAGANTGGWEIYGSNAATQILSIYSYAAASAIGTFSSTGLAVTGTLSSTGILSGPGFRASKTTATSGLVKIQDEGANVYNVIGSRNNADSAALPLNFQASNFAFNGAVDVTGTLGVSADINIGAGGNLILAGNFAKYIRANTGASSDLRLGGVNGVNIEVGSGFVTAASFSATGLAVTGNVTSTTGAELATSGGGNFVKIGSATAIGSGTGLLEITFNNAYYGQRVKTSNSGGGSVLQILKSTGTEVGLISHNDTVTTYGGTSDYRLKDITGPLTDSGTFIDALKPKVGTWKSNGSKFVGFIAHEFAEVSPSSVQGAKDAVDAEGNPKYQGMQASSAEVIANLVAELQSVRARLAALESK